MKVKNVVFSGFAAALFAGVCGAADAATVNLVSKSTFETEMAKKQDVLTPGDNITIENNVVSATGLVTTAALETIQTNIDKAIEDGDKAAADALAALQKEVEDLSGSVATSETMAALTERVKAIEDAPYAAKSYVDSSIEAVNALFADYYNKTEIDGKLALKADKTELTPLATTTALQSAVSELTALINGKQAAGEYLVAADLKTLEDAVATLESGKATVADLTALQTAVSKLGETYATDAELSAAVAAVEAKIPSLTEYAKTADVAATYATISSLNDVKATADAAATKTYVDEELGKKQDKLELGANLQFVDGKLDTKGIATADGLEALETTVAGHTTSISQINSELALKAVKTEVSQAIADALAQAKQYADDNDTDTVYDETALAGRVTAIEGAGYQNASQVEAAVTTATADLATKASVTAVDTKADNNATAITALQGKTEGLKALAYKDTVATADIEAAAVTPAKIEGSTPAEGEMMLMSTKADGSVEWMSVRVY